MIFRSRVLRYLCVSLAAVLPIEIWAQQAPSQQGQPTPAQPASAQPTLAPPAPVTASGTQGQAAAPTGQAEPKDPYIIEDGGFSIEPLYWLNVAQPKLYAGKTTNVAGNYDYAGNAKYALGGVLSIPAGAQNSLRVSYFRVQGNSNNTINQAETIFSEAYTSGDYLSASYRLQDFKLSWDYLSYNWYKGPGTLRLKTLYEVQYLTISTDFYAPFAPATVDASGNTDYNTAHGSKNLIYPSFGLELEQALGKHFRWEAKASGFGLPHRATLWDAEGSIGYRVGAIELLAGEKAFHFKTSPQQDMYFSDTLSGAYVGIRYYWGTSR